MATLELLERHGVEVEYPASQTCCGQPMANTGCIEDARPLAEMYFRTFNDFTHVVCPSGSCTAMVRRHYKHYLQGNQAFGALCQRTYELCEFLVDVIEVDRIQATFPHRVGLHESCHGLRELRMGSCSERVEPDFGKTRQLLRLVEGVEIVTLSRRDECCGFGGTFAVGEEAVSCRMGLDRIADHRSAGAEVITAADMSCLMHLSGLMRRREQDSRGGQTSPETSLPVMHIAEILAGRSLPQVEGVAG
jgi:L-lactate dehydrogenase complex protein LldE